jgi:hypothetical protein
MVWKILKLSINKIFVKIYDFVKACFKSCKFS